MRDLIDKLSPCVESDDHAFPDLPAADYVQRSITEALSEPFNEENDGDLLLEIDMSPDNLRQKAAAIDARAGMEFEMLVPGQHSLPTLASRFRSAVGRPVNYSYRYHGAQRASNTYCIEPDGSLRPSRRGHHVGWEFVSPPLKVAHLLSDLAKVQRWARNFGCYTNSSCGLHMSVSVPVPTGRTLRQKLNYTKLVLLVGDEAVLRQYGRDTSTYCASAMKKIKAKARGNRQLAAQILSELRGDFLKRAGRMLDTGVTRKMESINVKDTYVEFRSPGGDYLSKSTEELTLTLLRFVVALDAACDTNKYRRLYRARLEALVTGRDPMTIQSRGNQGPRLETNVLVDLFSGEAEPEALAALLIPDEDIDPNI